MVNRFEAFGRPPGDALGRRIRRYDLGMIGLELFQFVQQTIEFPRLETSGSLLNVIALLVVADQRA